MKAKAVMHAIKAKSLYASLRKEKTRIKMISKGGNFK